MTKYRLLAIMQRLEAMGWTEVEISPRDKDGNICRIYPQDGRITWMTFVFLQYLIDARIATPLPLKHGLTNPMLRQLIDTKYGVASVDVDALITFPYGKVVPGMFEITWALFLGSGFIEFVQELKEKGVKRMFFAWS